jgi:hypothetical protein
VLTYSFAQDDFTLILNASTEPGRGVIDFFAASPGQFRPLTKVFYFAAMHTLFGLNAFPYHLLSIAVHLINTVLVFLIMRQLRVGGTAALIISTLFATSMSFFHVIAWISCIQQLAALCFALFALRYGLLALSKDSQAPLWISLAAYGLSLMSMEQGALLPVSLILAAWFGLTQKESSRSFLASARLFAPHLVVMIVYLAFMVLWKGLPSDGPYSQHMGINVFLNLTIYLGWLFDYWIVLPNVMQTDQLRFAPSHILFAGLIVYNIARGRTREVVFGAGFVLMALLPVAFLKGHTFYLHTYIPSFGMFYLVGLVIDELTTLRVFQRRAERAIITVVILGSICTLSSVKGRQNESAVLPLDSRFKSSFVLRRAVIAQQARQDLASALPDPGTARELIMLYPRRAGRDEANWNYQNVIAALGNGDAIRLFVDRPSLNVRFKILGDDIPDPLPEDMRLLLFDDFGRCVVPSTASGL